MRRHLIGDQRLGAILVALALIVAACGSDPSAPAADAGSATGGASGSTASGGGAGGSAAGDTGGGTAGGGGASATGGGGGGSTGGSTGTPDPAPAVIGVGSLPVGDVAPALLQPGRGDRVVLEVRAQDGAEPRQATLDHLVSVLKSASGKSVVVDGIDGIGGGAREWSQRDVIAAAAAAAQVESGRSQVVLRLLFLRGTYGGDRGVLGVAVAGDVAAVFSDQVDSAAGLLVDPAVVEDAVSMHEIGHLLALVDLILGTGRGDPDHPGHSRNRRSVMYWQVESSLITQLLDGGIPRDFDADDRAELAQIRAG